MRVTVANRSGLQARDWLARKLSVSAPIIDQVHAVLYESKNVARAVEDLTRRESKAED